MKVTFVRHTAPRVPRGTCYGRTDVPLAETFLKEVIEVRNKLEGKCFDYVLTSPSSRCYRLAMCCGYKGAILDGRLMEMNFGEWEMKRYDEITDPRLHMWYDDYFNVAATGGESFVEQGVRVRASLDELKERGFENVLIFTHGGVILQAMLIAGVATRENLFDHLPPYGSVLELEI